MERVIIPINSFRNIWDLSGSNVCFNSNIDRSEPMAKASNLVNVKMKTEYPCHSIYALKSIANRMTPTIIFVRFLLENK
jgi:hypothetical protein